MNSSVPVCDGKHHGHRYPEADYKAYFRSSGEVRHYCTACLEDLGRALEEDMVRVKRL